MYNRQLLSLSYTAMNFKICKTIHVFKGFLCSFHMRNVISNDKKNYENEMKYNIRYAYLREKVTMDMTNVYFKLYKQFKKEENLN